ncbi:MAG TPA: hypothetical protein VGQ67_08400 [Candidatus Polarisedimenticolia bacterium]|jgi:hypothetical protein|nr:hypothetical protein [Candidatus Polarisedimenticolia bacterium]
MGLVLMVFAALMFFGLLAFVATIVLLPFVLACALIVMLVRLAIFFVMLPFRLLGWMLRLAVRPAMVR